MRNKLAQRDNFITQNNDIISFFAELYLKLVNLLINSLTFKNLNSFVQIHTL